MEGVPGRERRDRGWGQIREIPRRRTAGMPVDGDARGLEEERFLGIGLERALLKKGRKGFNWNSFSAVDNYRLFSFSSIPRSSPRSWPVPILYGLGGELACRVPSWGPVDYLLLPSVSLVKKGR